MFGSSRHGSVLTTVLVRNVRWSRSALLPLFALADDSQAQISTYISLGEVLVARHDDAFMAHLQLLETDDPAVFEIKSMAVSQT
jgi:hypothetical protein